MINMIKVTRTSHTKRDSDLAIGMIKPQVVTTITHNDQKIAEVTSVLCVWNNDLSDMCDETLIFYAKDQEEKFGDYDDHDEAVEDILSRLNILSRLTQKR